MKIVTQIEMEEIEKAEKPDVVIHVDFSTLLIVSLIVIAVALAIASLL